MWKTLALQNLVFFLFFQPALLSRRRVRWLALAGGLGALGVSAAAVESDPFAWAYAAAGLALAYWTANKALRWVFANRELVERESKALERREAEVRERTLAKESEIRELQAEIQRVSDLYENLKDMSAALEVLDLFLDFSQALMKHFPVRRTRFLLLADSDGRRSPEKIYEADRERLESRAVGKSLAPKEAFFQGERYPTDARLVEELTRSEGPWRPPQAGAEGGGAAEGLFAFPLKGESGLEAALVIEGALPDGERQSLSILTDRFLAEFKRIRLYEDVQRLATTDWVTGLFVRRHFFKRLEEEIGRSQRFHLRFSFLMIDIDDFKTYNDRYGHLVGDAILKQTALLIRQNVREGDLVARYGGEEFAALLLDTDAEGAMFVGQRIRKSVERERFRVYDEEIAITVSVGVATYGPKMKEGSEIVERADSALYQAKRQGKNRVCAFVS
jgi:diguanylate cyclase (GGDEF)-like protein